MKTFWTEATVFNGRSGQEGQAWLRAKQVAFENKTAVAWTCEHNHGGYQFHPYMRREDALWADEDVAERMLAWLNAQDARCLNYKTLLAISEGIGVPLPEVCGTAWELSRIDGGREAKLKVTVDRMGKSIAVALRR